MTFLFLWGLEYLFAAMLALTFYHSRFWFFPFELVTSWHSLNSSWLSFLSSCLFLGPFQSLIDNTLLLLYALKQMMKVSFSFWKFNRWLWRLILIHQSDPRTLLPSLRHSFRLIFLLAFISFVPLLKSSTRWWLWLTFFGRRGQRFREKEISRKLLGSVTNFTKNLSGSKRRRTFPFSRHNKNIVAPINSSYLLYQ